MTDLYDKRIDAMRLEEHKMQPYIDAMRSYQDDCQEQRNTARLAAYHEKMISWPYRSGD